MSLSLICWASREAKKRFGLGEDDLGHRMECLVGGTGLWGTVRIAQLSRHRRFAFSTSGQTPTVMSVSPARWQRRSKRPRTLAGGAQRDPEGTSR